MNTPRDWADERAREIVNTWDETDDSDYSVNVRRLDDLESRIAAALRIKPGHFRDDKGVERKVCSHNDSHTGYTTIVLEPVEAAEAAREGE